MYLDADFAVRSVLVAARGKSTRCEALLLCWLVMDSRLNASLICDVVCVRWDGGFD